MITDCFRLIRKVARVFDEAGIGLDQLSGVAVTFVMEKFGWSEIGFVFNAAYMGGFMMAVYTPALLWMNLRHLPRGVRPGPLNIVMMVNASVVYIGFALYSLAAELGFVAG